MRPNCTGAKVCVTELGGHVEVTCVAVHPFVCGVELVAMDTEEGFVALDTAEGVWFVARGGVVLLGWGILRRPVMK